MQKTSDDFIPKIADDKLAELYLRVRPVAFVDGSKFYVQPCDLRYFAYTFSPLSSEKVADLEVIGDDVTTYHEFTYYGCFYPSVAEVLAQVQDKPWLEDVVAFEIVEWPKVRSDLDNADHKEALEADCHTALTRFYRSVR